MKLILIGPGDSVKGGATISFRYLLEELDKSNIEYLCLKTDSTKTSLGNIFSFLKHLFQIFRNSDSETIISLHASNKRIAAYSVFLNRVVSFTGAALMIRVFGGNHDAYLNSQPSFYRKLIIQTYRKNVLLLQTKGLITNFKKKFQVDDIIWFPTSRPKNEKYQKKGLASSKTLNLLFVGHLKEEKGIYDLLEIAKKAEQENLDLYINLYGEPGDIDFLKQVSVSSKIGYGGVLEKEEIYEVMYHSDILLFPSKYEGEGYPGVLIEAINVNLPVIATNHQYNNEVIRDNMDGNIYETGEINALWKIIKDLYNDQCKLDHYIQNLIAKEEKFYSEKWNGEVFRCLVEKLST